jgi:type I restriction enzyme M protein
MMNGEIKRKINSTRDILVGVVPTPSEQVQQITYALIYKFMDDMDQEAAEKYGSKSYFFSGEYEKYAWHNIMAPNVSGQERVNLYTQGIEKMQYNENLPQLFRDMFKNAFVPFRNANTLNMFLKEINEFKYDHSEELGNAYEYLLSIMGSQGDAGMFRTPRNIIDFVVEAVDPKRDETILDPACGTAGFLISSYKHIKKKEEENKDFKVRDQKNLAENLVGYEISPQMAQLSRVNMYLHKFLNPKIYEYDTLSSEERWEEKFDIIMANPPFMTPKGGIQPHNKFSVQAKRSEVLFVDYIAEHLNPRGRAGVIVPEGIVFKNENAYKQLRKMLLEENYLYAVVSLPAGVFQPYAGVKTSILFFDKELAKKTDDILFAKVENDGYELGATRKEIDKNDLPEVMENIKKYQEYLRSGEKNNEFIEYINNRDKNKEKLKVYDKYAVVDKEKIAEEDYNLSAERYREEADYSNVKWPMVYLKDLEKEGKIDFLRGGELSKKDLKEEGRNKCIHYGELYTVYKPIIKKVTSRTNFEGKVFSVKGDVLIPATTTADAMGIAVARSLKQDNVIIGGDINIIRTKNKYILSDYLALLISSLPLKEELANYAKGVNILHLSNKDIKNLKIPLPPLEEQEKIVEELDRYQKIIDGAQQVIDNYQPTIKINPEWEKVKLGDNNYFKVESGGTPNSKEKEYWNGSINWATLVDLPSDDFITEIKETQRKITEKGLKKSSAILLPKDSIIVSTRATIGRVGIAKEEISTNQGFKNIVIKSKEKANDKFVALMIRMKRKELQQMGTGGTYPEVSKSRFCEIEIPLPPLGEQEKIVKQIEQEQQLVDQNQKLIQIFQQKIQDKINDIWGID